MKSLHSQTVPMARYDIFLHCPQTADATSAIAAGAADVVHGVHQETRVLIAMTTTPIPLCEFSRMKTNSELGDRHPVSLK